IGVFFFPLKVFIFLAWAVEKWTHFGSHQYFKEPFDFEDDDVYGQSVEDDYCISPSTAAQFIYSRRDKPATFAEPLEEEYGYEGTDSAADCFTPTHQLTEVDRARLNSCLDQMREVLAESIPEQAMVQAVLDTEFDVQKALDLVLSQGSKQNVKTKNKDAVILAKTTKGKE
uniref:HBS1 like translational GTPase n=1 Tax=Ficedula albicollis TaxID=59894 RepID=A0A803VFS1_FICAL